MSASRAAFSRSLWLVAAAANATRVGTSSKKAGLGLGGPPPPCLVMSATSSQWWTSLTIALISHAPPRDESLSTSAAQARSWAPQSWIAAR
ncbi:hypothetical protein M885DRAFT_527200 [Pelagophyceae sp. CCMP2097]|nr:hypothetical protein M885DRAFT_527200 [Pelagophyceae sp. CCMP2097]